MEAWSWGSGRTCIRGTGLALGRTFWPNDSAVIKTKPRQMGANRERIMWTSQWDESRSTLLRYFSRCKQGKLLGGISDPGSLDVSKVVQRVFVRAGLGENVLDSNPVNHERVRNERTVAAPGNCFGTHNGGSLHGG